MGKKQKPPKTKKPATTKKVQAKKLAPVTPRDYFNELTKAAAGQVPFPAPLAKAPTRPVVRRPCLHPHLAFVEAGRRLRCEASDCGRTWVLETRPGSWMADVGMTNFGFVPEGEARLAPGAAPEMKSLHPPRPSGKVG